MSRIGRKFGASYPWLLFGLVLCVLGVLLLGGLTSSRVKQEWAAACFLSCPSTLALFDSPAVTAGLASDPSSVPPLERRLHNDLSFPRCCLVIAHAGGAVEGQAYTNSLEALEASYARGWRILELDFLISSDGDLVLAHDWDRYGGARLSKDAFLHRDAGRGLTTLDLERLVGWLLSNPGVRVVTDTKDSFEVFLKVLRRRLPDWFIQERFILQVYDQGDVELVEETLPGARMILTLYKLETPAAVDFDAVNRNRRILAVTVPVELVDRGGAGLAGIGLNAEEKPVLTHGPVEIINSRVQQDSLQALGVSGFYLD